MCMDTDWLDLPATAEGTQIGAMYALIVTVIGPTRVLERVTSPLSPCVSNKRDKRVFPFQVKDIHKQYISYQTGVRWCVRRAPYLQCARTQNRSDVYDIFTAFKLFVQRNLLLLSSAPSFGSLVDILKGSCRPGTSWERHLLSAPAGFLQSIVDETLKINVLIHIPMKQFPYGYLVSGPPS